MTAANDDESAGHGLCKFSQIFTVAVCVNCEIMKNFCTTKTSVCIQQ